MKRFEEKTIVVTGAASGIGLKTGEEQNNKNDPENDRQFLARLRARSRLASIAGLRRL